MLDDAPLIVVWLFLSFAAYRTTRFVIADTLIEGLRGWFQRWCFERRDDVEIYRPVEVGGPVWLADGLTFLRGKLGDLLTCAWCTGWWASLIGTCLVVGAWPWGLGIDGWVLAWAVAGGQGLLSAIEGVVDATVDQLNDDDG